MFRIIGYLLSLALVLVVISGAGILYAFYHFGRGLPDYHQLAHYEPPITSRVYAGDGRLIAEYATERRTFVPLEAMPDLVKHAFLAAEDKTFYTHSGIDIPGVVRAIVINARAKVEGADRRPVGASTITQQVAKNFLLTNEVSLDRKIKEAILAFRIERAFSKDHILELYLNEIFLGFRSYGIAAAALNYFNKGLDELSVAEAAFLAALPKGPNNYNPLRYPDAAYERRNWVIGRMLEDGYITSAQADEAARQEILLRSRTETEQAPGGDYFAEDIRRELFTQYGDKALYEGGLSVRSTMDPRLQQIANRVLRAGLSDYDRRHGWRGALAHIDIVKVKNWSQALAQANRWGGIEGWRSAVVLELADHYIRIGFEDGREGVVPFDEMKWARPVLPGGALGASPRRPADIVKVGDVIVVETLDPSQNPAYPAQTYALRQIPKVEGALVAIDPHTGRVLAMSGGFSFARSQFNRASQALRQPGSAFKPFVYLAALESGYTPSSLVMDAPIALPQGPGLPLWRPKNYSDDYLGPTTLRVGIEKSRNLMTVRLAAAVGMNKISDYTKRFGINDNLPKVLSMALGAGETTPLRLTAAYAMLVNGGKAIQPTLIDRIQDRHGRTIYSHDRRPCDECLQVQYSQNDVMPRIADTRQQLVDPVSAYQMVHILEGVVERGTATKVQAVGKPLAGKTGTSNDSMDVWFVGFSPDLAVGVFVGYDEPKSLGEKETGGSTAAPIFRDFMMEALKDKEATPFRVPPGVRFARVNAATGRPAASGDRQVIFEAFRAEPEEQDQAAPSSGTPQTAPPVLDGGVPDPESHGGTDSPVPVLPQTPSTPKPAQPSGGVPEAGGLY